MRILVTDGMDKSAMAALREKGHEVVEQYYEPEELGKALRPGRWRPNRDLRRQYSKS